MKVKKIFWLLLVLCLVAALCSCGNNESDLSNNKNQGNTDGDDEEQLKYSKGLVFILNKDGTYSVDGKGTCTDTDIVIPSKHKGKAVTRIDNSAFLECKTITSVVIPDSVTSIGSGAFGLCESLTSVVIPDSVTKIESCAFSGTALQSIKIPNSVMEIEFSTFSLCKSLISIVIPNSVTSIGDFAFSFCTSLTSIVIPNSVTSIGNSAFSHCSSLSKITIPYSVSSLGTKAFYDCGSLVLYCEVGRKPFGWDDDWNSENHHVVWGYGQ